MYVRYMQVRTGLPTRTGLAFTRIWIKLNLTRTCQGWIKPSPKTCLHQADRDRPDQITIIKIIKAQASSYLLPTGFHMYSTIPKNLGIVTVI